MYMINKKMTAIIEKKRARERGEEEPMTDEEKELAIGGEW